MVPKCRIRHVVYVSYIKLTLLVINYRDVVNNETPKTNLTL